MTDSTICCQTRGEKPPLITYFICTSNTLKYLVSCLHVTFYFLLQCCLIFFSSFYLISPPKKFLFHFGMQDAWKRQPTSSLGLISHLSYYCAAAASADRQRKITPPPPPPQTAGPSWLTPTLKASSIVWIIYPALAFSATANRSASLFHCESNFHLWLITLEKYCQRDPRRLTPLFPNI